MKTAQAVTDREVALELLHSAGIGTEGKEDWDLKILDSRFYTALLQQGNLGAGEAYMDGWWNCRSLDQAIEKIIRTGIHHQLRPAVFLKIIVSKTLNLQTVSRSRKVADVHYDLGNEFYKKMLDKRMQYTCAYWRNSSSLEEAQLNKLRLIGEKLCLKPGEKVLELGCGWGGLARFLAENYGCRVTAYNISKEQVSWAREYCKGFPVDIKQADYREAEGLFDKVVSIGLCEHIGPKNYRHLFHLVHQCLKPYGLFLLHTIGGNRSRTMTDPWLNKYIFPDSVLPSARQLSESAEGLFTLEDWHNFGSDYDKTLIAWYQNFRKNWPTLKSGRFDQRFYRMWEYYLLLCAGSFRVRENQLWQIVYSKGGVPGGYTSIR